MSPSEGWLSDPRTDRDGAITIETDGQSIRYRTYRKGWSTPCLRRKKNASGLIGRSEKRRAPPDLPRFMIAFFDSNVHIGLLLGYLSLETIVEEVGSMPVRLSPVVASELLRGVSGQAQRSVEKLINQLVPLEPPSWRQCWHETGRLLPRLFPQHEEVGLARLQNDCLLALTSRHTGALLVTADAHFETIRRYVSFRMKKLTT